MRRFWRALVVGAAVAGLVCSAGMTAIGQPRPVVAGNTKADAFPPSASCGCHAEFVSQWRQSMHSKALEDPLFKAKVEEGDAATGGKLGPFCEKCHGPVAAMTGQQGVATMTASAAESIDCGFCHQVTGATEPLGNVSQLVDPSGTFRAQLPDPHAPHPAAVSPFHATSAICGGCHNVNHPANGMHLESTYAEWEASPQAKSGVQCQDCHMSAAPGQVGPSPGWAAGGGPQRPAVYQMTFVGGQVGLSGDPLLAKELLQSAARVTMSARTVVKSGEDASVSVTITNTGAGHYLPTGLTEVRQMWLQVSVVDPAGKETVLGKHEFGTVLKDDKGNHPVELWNATGVFSDDRIPPQGSVTDSYKLALPSGVDSATLKAELMYRSAPDELAKKAKVDNPVTIMASAEQPLYASQDAQRAAAAKADSGDRDPMMPLVMAIVGLAIVAGTIIFLPRMMRERK